MTEQLTRPGTDPEVHDRGWRSPVGFIQNAYFESRPGIHVEAVEVTPWIEGADRHYKIGDRIVTDEGAGAWGEEPEGRIRLVIGPRDGNGWANGYTDLTLADARELRDKLQDEIRRLTKASTR